MLYSCEVAQTFESVDAVVKDRCGQIFFPLSPSCRSPESGWLVVKT